ncbi:MAG: multicopper oxidase family protein [Burkholderiales bacterium]
MMNGSMSGKSMGTMDLNDVDYDAYLTNYQTPQDPQIAQAKAGGKVKLRFINGSASSNFWINLDKLSGTAVAVDGHNITPITGSKFQLAVAQRIDVVVNIPKQGGTFPILGQVEGLKNQTGLVLTTDKSLTHTVIADMAATAAPALDNTQELKLHSIKKVATKKVDRVIKYALTGSMSPYVWQINQQSWPNVTPAQIQQGKRVELDFINQTTMAHPMHLHGYGFKVIKINGKKVDGAVRDTVLVLPNSSVKVIFDATATGKWFIHCHILYHMPAGMMTYLEVVPNKNSSKIEVKKLIVMDRG